MNGLNKKKDEVRYKSWKRYQQIVNGHLIPYFEDWEINSITKKDVQRYYQINKQKIRQSISKHKTVINQIFDYAENMEYITSEQNTARAAKAFAAKKQRPGNIVHNPEELQNFVSSFSNSCLYLPLLLAAQTGARASEITALRWKDIDFKKGTMSITKTLHYDTKKGYYEEAPKSEASRRYIHLPEQTLKFLSKIKETREAADDDYICLNSLGYPFNTNTLCTNFRRAARVRGYELSFKDIRKTFINLLRDAGVEDTAIAEEVGHVDLRTTRKNYFVATAQQRKKREQIKNSIFNFVNDTSDTSDKKEKAAKGGEA